MTLQTIEKVFQYCIILVHDGNYRKRMRHLFDYIRMHKWLLLIILPAFFLFMLVIFPSGTFLCFKDACGVNFWGAHGHDGIWHLAIANVAFQKFPFIAPTFAGESLYGYNYLLDFIIFLFTKIGIPAIISYFKIFPVLWFVLFTALLIILARKIKDKPIFVALFLFFNYFAGSFSYFLTLYHHGTTHGSAAILTQPILHMMVNIPYAFSLLFFLYLLILLKEKSSNTKTILLASLCVFMIMGLKFYGGVISIFFVGFYFTITQLFQKTKKYFFNIAIFCLFIGISILFFYNPQQSFKTGSVFGFAPLALVHTITETPDQFYLQSMTDARYFLMASHKIGPRLIGIEILNVLIFLTFYLGVRMFGLVYAAILFFRKKLDAFDITVMLTILFSILLTTTLVQKAEWWNVVQFFYYAIFLSTIFLSKFTYDVFVKSKPVSYILVVVLLLLSVPTALDLPTDFAATPGASYLPAEEKKALDFLKKQPEGVVLTPLYNEKWKTFVKTNELFVYTDTAYISAFSGKQTYMADILQLRLTGVPYKTRLERLKRMDCSILHEVAYVYELRRIPDEDKIMIKCKPKNATKIYNSDSIFIYSIKNSQ